MCVCVCVCVSVCVCIVCVCVCVSVCGRMCLRGYIDDCVGTWQVDGGVN